MLISAQSYRPHKEECDLKQMCCQYFDYLPIWTSDSVPIVRFFPGPRHNESTAKSLHEKAA